jgi:hypothetical protein
VSSSAAVRHAAQRCVKTRGHLVRIYGTNPYRFDARLQIAGDIVDQTSDARSRTPAQPPLPG